MKINEIPTISKSFDFISVLCTFLDEFYRTENNQKSLLISDEPEIKELDKKQYCNLAATVHKLANDFNLPVPAWVMKEKYFMPYPVYAFNVEDKEGQDLLRQLNRLSIKIEIYYLALIF